MMLLLTTLLNLVLKTGTMLTDWTVGIIKPLYQGKGSKLCADNYRGITLLSCIRKLFTSTINERLTSYLNGVGFLGEEQAGFRAGSSTSDHFFVLHNVIDLYLYYKKCVYCALIDYKKAFDLVERRLL